MGYKILYIWVEGRDDVTFFDKIIKPIFDEKYDWVEVREYAKEQSKYITGFVKSIKAMPADYIFDAFNKACNIFALLKASKLCRLIISLSQILT